MKPWTAAKSIFKHKLFNYLLDAETITGVLSICVPVNII